MTCCDHDDVVHTLQRELNDLWAQMRQIVGGTASVSRDHWPPRSVTAPGLTPAEADAFQQYAQGVTLADIATGTGVSVETVRTQVKRARRKLTVAGYQVRTREESRAAAIMLGLLLPQRKAG